MKKFSKIVSLMLAAVLVVSAFSMSALAFDDGRNYEPVAGSSITFNKYLIVPVTSSIPAIEFNFEIAAGSPRSADTSDNSVMQVLAGVTPDAIRVGSAVFTEGMATSTTTDATMDVARTDRRNVVFGENEKFAVTTVSLDFSRVAFNEPGIYRYIITETANAEHAAAGFVHDDDVDRVLDVYVTDDGEGNLVVSAYVLHKNDEDVVIGTNMGSDDVDANGDRLADKTDGFTNEYNPDLVNLVFKKEVYGNQASRDKVFEFTVSLENLAPGKAYVVSLADDGDDNTVDGNAPATSGTNSATIAANAGKTNVTSITADAEGKVTQKFYLAHGQYIAIRDLPQEAVYSVTENAEDYKSEAATVANFTDPVSGIMGSADKYTSYKNTRNGIIPTGVVLTVLPGIALIGVSAAGIVLSRRNRKNED